MFVLKVFLGLIVNMIVMPVAKWVLRLLYRGPKGPV